MTTIDDKEARKQTQQQTAVVILRLRPLIRYLSKRRYEQGMYEGSDESNVKVELFCDKMAEKRKVSKMINGLGDDDM